MRRSGWAALACVAAGCSFRDDRPREIVREAVAAHAATAREPEPEPIARRLAGAVELSLPDCMRAALEGYESLQIRSERIFDAQMQRREAIAAVLPHVALHGRHTRDEEEVAFGGREVSPERRDEAYLTVTQPIFNGRLGPTLDMIEQTRRIEQLRLRDERDRLLFEVAARFYEAMAAACDVGAREARRDAASEALRVALVRREVGEATGGDVGAAQAEAQEAEAALARAGNDVERARAALSELVGIDPLPALLVDTLEVRPVPDGIPMLSDRALRERLDLQAARHETERARAQGTRTAREYLPVLDAEFTYWLEREGGFNEAVDWSAAVVLRWDLFDGGGREARLARALSTVRQRDLERRQMERRVRAEVREAALSCVSLDRARGAFAEAARAAAIREAEALARRGAGEATAGDVARARAERAQADAERERSDLAHRLAVLRVRLAVGDLREGTLPATGEDP